MENKSLVHGSRAIQGFWVIVESMTVLTTKVSLKRLFREPAGGILKTNIR
jgi:hypothetical protein